MTFPSYSYIFIFLPIVITVYFLLNKWGKYTVAKCVLLAASLYFYSTFGLKGLIMIVLMTAITYAIGTWALSEGRSDTLRKTFMIIGIVLNTAVLLYCKYLVFFEIFLYDVTGNSLTYKAFVLPVGISYFTFSQIAYLVDSYRNPKGSACNILDYALFVTFFPKITVGPIALSTEMIPQFNDITRKQIDYDKLAKGMYGFVLGLAKKLILADTLGNLVDTGYLSIANLNSVDALLVIVGYTLQIYFDFSGYCDMAIGICSMLGFELPDNFDAPYRALSITEFWKRWHITLTRFFRNYIYIPLGGNRKGTFRTYLNTFIIFFISGLWHGAAFHYVLWGVIHGVGMIISKLAAPVTRKLPKALRWLVTFIFVNLTWVYFRAPDVGSANMMIGKLFTGGIGRPNTVVAVAGLPIESDLLQWILAMFASDYTYLSTYIILAIIYGIALWLSTKGKTVRERVDGFVPSRGRVAVTVLLFVWSVISLSDIADFIYVNF